MPSAAAEIATVYAVFPDAAEAKRIRRAMVEAGHAACVNVLPPCQSIFRWEGRVTSAREVPALFKVAADRADILVREIAALHSYDVPAIAVWPIVLAPERYVDWIRS